MQKTLRTNPESFFVLGGNGFLFASRSRVGILSLSTVMHTCEKIYTDIPIGHVQHRHPGHCSFIHGHNWSLTLTFACEELDHLGFVIDFGGIKFINQWISENLDHAFMFAKDDTEGLKMLAAFPHLFKPYIIDNCSAEGLATHLFDVFDSLVRKESGNRAWLKAIKVGEDSKNFAYFSK